jgi:hypothetical protein
MTKETKFCKNRWGRRELTRYQQHVEDVQAPAGDEEEA